MQQLDAPDDVHQHVTVVAWLFVVGNAVFLAIGAFLFLLLTGIGLSVDDVEARSILLVVGPAVGMLQVILAAPGLLAGYGLLHRQSWGRVLAIVVAILGMVNFPLGTAIGAYALWVLFSPAAHEYFRPQADSRLHAQPHS